MGHHFVTKTVATSLVPCLILYGVGCYTYQDVALKKAEVDEHLIIGTQGGHYYRFAEWKADSLGNISGRGVECSTLQDARDSRYTGTYKGTIPADSIYVLQADQPDTKATMALIVAPIVILVAVGFLALARGLSPS